MNDSSLLWFGGIYWLGIIVLIFILVFQRSKSKQFLLSDRLEEIEELKQQCQRLREELKQQSQQLQSDFQETTFTQLQTLLTNYPSACTMIQAKPDLPAKNLIALFAPLENLLKSWGYKTIGKPWEQVSYNPQLHQPDTDDISVGELVYIRFIGYCTQDKIIYPAKVSRTLPINQE
jgi:molecular chaperone GrpE (heat shock protein)